jgi:hypothetical protein
MKLRSSVSLAHVVTSVFWIVALVVASPAALAAIPEVGIDLRFEANDYVNLPDSTKKSVKEDLEPTLCQILNFHYPFVHWVPSAEASAQDIRFAPALYDDALRGVSLQFEAYVPEKEIGGVFDLGPQVMSAGGAKPYDAANILKKVRRPLVDHISADDFRARLFENFIRFVKLATDAIPVKDVIVVPFDFTDMNADRVTRLDVDVRGKLNREKKEGTLGLTPIRKREEPPHVGETEADVVECPGISDTPTRAARDLARLLKAKRVDAMYVRVSVYKRLPRVDNYGNARSRS